MLRQIGASIERVEVSMILALVVLSLSALKLPAQTVERKKVAEGEYLTSTDNPYNKEERLRESWILWRIGDGQYVVESDLQFENEIATKAAFHHSIVLSQDLRPQEIKILALASPEKNEIDVQLKPEEIRVKDRNGESILKVPPRYDIYYPLTPWSLSSFARRTRPVKDSGLAVEFVAMDEEGPKAPTALTLLWGRVRWIGREQVEVAGQRLSTEKYIIHLGPYPGVFVWLSEEGVVLGSQSEENSKQKTETVRFRKYEELPNLPKPPQRKEPSNKN
jgi:hypothetical protein